MVQVSASKLRRRRLAVQGLVQGVGFRPFVYKQAQRLSLSGFVYNDSQGVTIEIEGQEEALAVFEYELCEKLPPLARIDAMQKESIPVCHETAFTIMGSQQSELHAALVLPDAAPCEACLHEISDKNDRRFQYPFTNCTHCGPRFTIIKDVPYDRARTTMCMFPMCKACQEEYNDPLNRRFHAQPNACASCGPQMRLMLWDERIQDQHKRAEDQSSSTTDPLQQAAGLLADGNILAVKGLGGYHLACDALNNETLKRLRQRKHREVKPFALMVPDLATARQLVEMSEAEAALLEARQRPIVLLTRRLDSPIAPEVASSSNMLGVMLPYTPLHHLLLRAYSSKVCPDRLAVLVMTSGNLSDEPVIYRDREAFQHLRPLSEGILTHNREIQMRCDDSLVRFVVGGTQFLRRARGYVPEPLELAFRVPETLLACGGHMKNTICFGREQQAFVSQHIGDLENLETWQAFEQTIEHFQHLFSLKPQIVAYDLHPAYLASRYALERELPQKIGVQHHHAHIASVLAEHGLEEPVIGIAADGTGYGLDGAIWGCEIMRAERQDFQRLAHLAYVPLPGGEQAVRQPWRMAAVYLHKSYGESFWELDIPFVRHLERAQWRPLASMIERGINCPPTSSLGRLFDAVAALLGLPGGNNRSMFQMDVRQYEGQAAMELEQFASAVWEDEACYPFIVSGQAPRQLDISSMICGIVEDIQRHIPAPRIARRFHCSLAEMFARVCVDLRRQTGLSVVALSGGVFQNRLLLEQLVSRLEGKAFRVYINQRVPPNDGGLSLGQLAVAAARYQAE